MNEEAEKKPGAAARLYGFAEGRRGSYAASILSAVIGVASGIVPYYAVSQIIVRLFAGERVLAAFLPWLGLALGGYVGKLVFHNLSTMLSHTATFATLSNIRKQVAAKLTRVPMGYVIDTPSGKLKNIMVEKIDSIEPTLAHLVPEMTSNLLVPLGIIIYIFTLDWRMALISLITLPIGALFFMRMMKGYGEKYPQYLDAGKHMNAVAVEYINGIEIIKTFSQSASSYKKFSEAVHNNAYYALDWMDQLYIYFAGGFGILPAVFLGVLPLGSILYMTGSLEAAAFITIMILSLGIMPPLIQAVNYTDDLAMISSIIDDITEVLDTPEQVRSDIPVKLDGYDISLHNVVFGYGKKEILHGISLNIPAGKVTALVGPSGGGKSTIAKLIASFWDVDAGSITLGKQDIKNIPPFQLMEQIAYVSQDNYLFDMSIRENIRMGKPNASDDEVEAVSKASGCHEFIAGLEQGYETIAGGAGGHLSGGERQRIAIARAMLKNAPIIILDEATAYTDPENEAVVQAAVAKLVAGKTLIVIAHRLSTITDSDQIAVVQSGTVHAVGTHESLLETNPLYQSMWAAHISARDVA